MVLKQNSSADRLGLNPAELIKWEKHKKSVSRSLVRISLWKEMFCKSGALMDYIVQQGKNSLSSIWKVRSLRCSFIDR